MAFVPVGRRNRQRGQAYIEFIVIFPLVVLLLLFVAAQGWYWWNQTSAAVAIRDGTAMAGHHGGSIEAGYQETYRALAAALGGTATDYAGKVHIQELGGMRATVGWIRNEQVVNVPFLGPQVFSVEAFSFQRHEAFYGGPPDYWE
jgi:hypothetical protein